MNYKDLVYCFKTLTFKEFIMNIQWSITGLSVAVNDPFVKREVEAELDMRRIKYHYAYDDNDKLYEYTILGGKKNKIMDFVKWFKADKNWTWSTLENGLTGKTITMLIK